jgi:glucokinase
MSTKDKFFLGLDIGASSIKFGWGNCQSGLQHFDKRELVQRSLSCLHNTVAEIIGECDRVIGLGHILSIGIGTPGTIDLATRKITGINPNLPFWVDQDPAELIPPEIQLPVYFDNDANLMCLGEAWLRGSRGRIAGITVGSGIGCGYVQDGHVYHGAHGYAMELGHITGIPDGELCSCGRKGCLEAYASIEGIKSRITRIGLSTTLAPRSGLRELLDAASSDPRVADAIAEGMTELARGIANFCVIIDPDTVVIGGGGMDGGLYDWEELRKLIVAFLPPINASTTSLERAREGNRAGVLGAVVLAEQSLFPGWE